jgi:hypothetical protein
VDHYKTISVQGLLSKTDDVVLVDDFVTRGAAFMGCANLLMDVFPDCRVKGFAGIRTISNSYEFRKVYDPLVGTIELLENGETRRRPS